MTGGELVVRCLEAQGVRHVFGIPGALNAGLYDALARQEAVQHILVRHELGAAWMADGYARASGEVGVCLTVPGPGATHAASGIAGAYTDCVPVLLVASCSETRWKGQPSRDLFHGLDQMALFAPITRWCGSVQRADEIAPVLERAFRELRSGRPGPVVVEIPADVLAGPAAGAVPEYVAVDRPEAAEALVAAAAALLRSAERPLLLADDGVLHSEAWEELAALATELQAPVITTIQGKSSIPESHPWSLGDMNSPAGQAAYAAADVLFAIGCRFGQTDIRWPWFTPPARLIHLDADPAEIGRLYPVEVGLVGDTRTVLRQVAAQLRALPELPTEGHAVGPLASALPARGWSGEIENLREKHRVRPRLPVLEALYQVMPPGAVAGFDVCLAGYRSRWEWPIVEPRSYLYPGLYVGMGYGLPAALGARVATGRPTIAICGDGGFQMTMAELGTAAQHGLPVVAVVINDGGLTLIRHVQDREYQGRRFAVDLRNPDFAAVAAAYGIASEQVRTPDAVSGAVARALQQNEPALIELLQPEA